MTDRAQHHPLGDDRTNSTCAPIQDPIHASILEGLVAETRRVLRVEAAPEHIDVASALLVNGDFTSARAVLACNVAGAFGYECRMRLICPSCSARAQRALARAMVRAAGVYSRPVALLATLPSKALDDLGPTLDAHGGNLGALRRRAWFRAGCVAGCGILEMPRTRDRRRWNVHLHGVLDLRLVGDDIEGWQQRAANEWADLAGVGGAVFSLEPLRSLQALASYGAKVSVPPPSWALSLSTVPGILERQLRRALHRRRLLVRWGASKRSKENSHA